MLLIAPLWWCRLAGKLVASLGDEWRRDEERRASEALHDAAETRRKLARHGVRLAHLAHELSHARERMSALRAALGPVDTFAVCVDDLRESTNRHVKDAARSVEVRGALRQAEADLVAASTSVARGRRSAVKIEILLGGEADLVQELQHGQSQQQALEKTMRRRSEQLRLAHLKASAAEHRAYHQLMHHRNALAPLVPPPRPTAARNLLASPPSEPELAGLVAGSGATPDAEPRPRKHRKHAPPSEREGDAGLVPTAGGDHDTGDDGDSAAMGGMEDGDDEEHIAVRLEARTLLAAPPPPTPPPTPAHQMPALLTVRADELLFDSAAAESVSRDIARTALAASADLALAASSVHAGYRFGSRAGCALGDDASALGDDASAAAADFLDEAKAALQVVGGGAPPTDHGHLGCPDHTERKGHEWHGLQSIDGASAVPANAAAALGMLLEQTARVLTRVDDDVTALSAKQDKARTSLRAAHRDALRHALHMSDEAAALDAERMALGERRAAADREVRELRDEIARAREPLTVIDGALASRCREACEQLHEAERLGVVIHARCEGGARLMRAAHERISLNVGGVPFETSLATLCSQPSVLSTMLTSSAAAPRDARGAIFLDRDASRFRHVLAFLRTGALPTGARHEALQRELLAEAKWLQMPPLISALESELDVREPRGLQLKRVSREAALGATCGDFERLLELLYTEAASCARRGLHQCQVGFTQSKLVHGRRYRSDVDSLWDATVSDEGLHRLLSSSAAQELLLSRLTEDNMTAQMKSLSKSEASHGEGGGRGRQWVSTTSHVLTVVIRATS